MYLCVRIASLVRWYVIRKVSNYDQEIPQPYTADQPTAPFGRASEH